MVFENTIKFTPLFASSSAMHLLMCAIHSAFSVGVAANTAKDFLGEIICHPFFHAIGKRQETKLVLVNTCTVAILYGKVISEI